ncbi:MAG TPA: threonine/serine dehydratase [Gemmatimonadaceae bacterium]|nr:threonine/serine dehydratase [Gemmatimonadaceae bacterium]
MIDDRLSGRAIRAVQRVIHPYVRRTPALTVRASEFGLPAISVSFKLELMQCSGSFKARGAFANLLTRPVPDAGVVAASGGNHGAAVAYAAMTLGVKAKIFVPTVSSPAKIARLREYGAEVEIVGDRYADALEASERWAERTGAMPVHAYDQLETLLGQGTLGMEIEEQCPEIDTLLVAVGGGGLIGGIAAWYRDRVDVVAVEPAAAPTLHRALAAGEPVDAEGGGVAADSLAPRRVGALMFPVAREFVRESVLVSDEAIVSAQQTLWNALRVVAEPGAAAAFAALLDGAYVPRPAERVGVIVCGGNTAAVSFA